MKNRFIVSIFLYGSILLLVALLGLMRTLNHIHYDNSSTHVSTIDLSSSDQWVQTFHDDFMGNRLDASKWVTCYDWREPTDNGCTNGGNFEQQWYLSQQVTVNNGVAVLTAVHEPVTAVSKGGMKTYMYRSGMISTGRPDTKGQVKWSTTYGYFEARMKFNGGQGVWPAFWLLPTDRTWPPEIDIMEFLGHEKNQILQTNHWLDSSGRPQKDSSFIQGPNFTQDWHTYAINWQPGRIDWYVDGELKKTVTGAEVPNKPMEIIINLAIGGLLPGNAIASTPFPRILQIDWVKVYELKHPL
jgi:beta-glucanase (GH16 family)